MAVLAIIGGTGSALLTSVAESDTLGVSTPYGRPSALLRRWQAGGHQFLFLPRHGPEALIPPHRVNYRANVWALRDAGADYVLALNAVGGIGRGAENGVLVFPDQIVDYTWGREHTYFDGAEPPLRHIDFTAPFSEPFHALLLRAAADAQLKFLPTGTYGATQGPRLETAAEIDRLERDGCSIVGMTGMPEAALARELELSYACCALVVNRAAGRGDGSIHSEIDANLEQCMVQVGQLLERLPPLL